MTPQGMAAIQAAHAERRGRWLKAIHDRLAQGPATTHDLIKASGEKGWRDASRVVGFLKVCPGIRKTGEKQPGPTGHENHVWELIATKETKAA